LKYLIFFPVSERWKCWLQPVPSKFLG